MDEQAVVRKVLWRLIPFGVVCYLLNYIDRVNISVAQLKMVRNDATHTGLPWFTSDIFDIGAGIFFLGYALFELPSNLIMERVGARRWIARIMVSWGIITVCFTFLERADPHQKWAFYGLRFLLGLAEAGFFPGMILYLSYWIPQRYRARAAALFLTSTALAGVVGNPLGGAIMYFTDNAPLGLQHWQWLFLTEGIPSIILGLITLFYLTDRPEKARWLTSEERLVLTGILARERAEHPGHGKSQLIDALRSKHTWMLSAIYSTTIFGFYMCNFYTPKIMESALISGGIIQPATPKVLSDLWSSLLAAVPFSAAAVGMVLIGRHSDRHNERKKHLAFACGCILVGMTTAGLGPLAGGGTGTILVIVGLSIGAIGAFGQFGPFWALPGELLTGTAAAAAFAIINSIGNLFGGYLGPMLKSVLGSMQYVLLIAAGLGGIGMVLALLAPVRPHADSGLEPIIEPVALPKE